MKKKIITAIIIVIAAAVVIAAGTAVTLKTVSPSVTEYTDGEVLEGVKQNYCFDNGRLLIGAYYCDPGFAEAAKEAGIDFVIESNVTPELLDEYGGQNIGIIAGGYNLGRFYGSASQENADEWKNEDPGAYKNHPALWGDDLIDEPSADCYGYLQQAVEAYRNNHPDKLCLINLFPIYANEEQLGEKESLFPFAFSANAFTGHTLGYCDKYKKYVSDYINTIDTDYICVDIYPCYLDTLKNGTTRKSTGVWYIRNLDILAQAARDTGRDFWVITQAAGLTADGKNGESVRWCTDKEDIAFQAYSSLAFGAKALIHAEFASKGWWDSASHMIDENGNKTDTYYAVKAVDEDIKTFAEEYGSYSYKGTLIPNPSLVAGYDRGKLCVYKEGLTAPVESENGILTGCFEDNSGNRAYIVANAEELCNQTTAVFTLTVDEGAQASVTILGKTENYTQGAYEISLAPGEGAWITVK